MEWEKLHYSGIRTHDNCNTSQTHQPLKNARQATNNSGDDHPEYQSATQNSRQKKMRNEKWKFRKWGNGRRYTAVLLLNVHSCTHCEVIFACQLAQKEHATALHHGMQANFLHYCELFIPSNFRFLHAVYGYTIFVSQYYYCTNGSLQNACLRMCEL